MKLVSVYVAPNATETLYELLAERTPDMNISHRAMPDWEDHVAFVASKPYAAWYVIDVPDVGRVGSVYLTKQREVGLFIFARHRGKGYGKQALAMLRERHPGRLLANIAPGNAPSHRFFVANGGRLIQQTYEVP